MAKEYPRQSAWRARKSVGKTGSAVRSQEIKAFNHSRLGANVNVELAAGYFRERYQGNEDTEQYPTLLHYDVALIQRSKQLRTWYCCGELLFPSDK